MAYLWRWTAAMPWTDRAACEGRLRSTYALQDPVTAGEAGLRLELP